MVMVGVMGAVRVDALQRTILYRVAPITVCRQGGREGNPLYKESRKSLSMTAVSIRHRC